VRRRKSWKILSLTLSRQWWKKKEKIKEKKKNKKKEKGKIF
jgi:hypothetical protein